MSSNWLVKPEQACLVSRCEKGARVFLSPLSYVLPISMRAVFHPTISFLFPQGIRSAFIDSKSIEIGNADIAANVLGCAAKVPSFSFSRILFRRQCSAETRVHPIFHVSLRLIATRLTPC